MTVLCFVNGCFTAANAYGLQLTFIDARNYPGGSWALMHSKERIPSAIMSDLSYHLTHFLADGVLVRILALKLFYEYITQIFTS